MTEAIYIVVALLYAADDIARPIGGLEGLIVLSVVLTLVVGVAAELTLGVVADFVDDTIFERPYWAVIGVIEFLWELLGDPLFWMWVLFLVPALAVYLFIAPCTSWVWQWLSRGTACSW